MKYRNCMIAYNPFSSDIVVGPHPDRTGWSDDYERAVGGCWLRTKTQSWERNVIQMLLDFHHAVVRDGVPVEAAHRAFSAIDEYREVMADDVPMPKEAA
jgi:hypothetical protein